MTTDDNAADPLGKFGNRAVLTKRETAEVLGRAPETIEDWIKRKLFPPWIQQTPGGPKEQLVSVIRAHLQKRRRARYVRPMPRGALMRGKQLRRQGNTE
ncbi:MAG: hypothetical protein AUI16_15190 [Alphaproteobacteria bacterium 13_2_20CM_2_64_7]|jgi:hypothetical protein|nr:MAG: hypothetical protein AUI16_15190 [Alphaproteobacteria bacterium 13_2_20CM_2_64_7]